METARSLSGWPFRGGRYDQQQRTVKLMLFMVIEHFKNGDVTSTGDRFKRSGRMLPEAVIYHASWIDSRNARCFQIMEAPDRQSLTPWIEDLE